MLYEFALDPEVLSTWQSFRYFIDRFGVYQGRMISRFPRRWKRLVYDASVGCHPIERQRIVEILAAQIDQKLVRTNRPYENEISWLPNAEAAHRLQPFHAIISRENPRNVEQVLVADDVDETRGASPLWTVSRTERVPRRAADIAGMAASLLSRSSELILIDAYFNPGRIEFRNPLEQFVRRIAANGLPRRLEYHLRADHENAPNPNFFQETCRRRLPGILPAGVELKVVRWNQRVGGREFHARYLLTELGGIRFDPGLDEGDDGQLTTMDLIELDIHADLWGDFPVVANVLGTTYEFSDEVIIIGTA